MLLFIIRSFNFMQLDRGGFMLGVKRCQNSQVTESKVNPKGINSRRTIACETTKDIKQKENITGFYSEYQPRWYGKY